MRLIIHERSLGSQMFGDIILFNSAPDGIPQISIFLWSTINRSSLEGWLIIHERSLGSCGAPVPTACLFFFLVPGGWLSKARKGNVGTSVDWRFNLENDSRLHGQPSVAALLNPRDKPWELSCATDITYISYFLVPQGKDWCYYLEIQPIDLSSIPRFLCYL